MAVQARRSRSRMITIHKPLELLREGPAALRLPRANDEDAITAAALVSLEHPRTRDKRRRLAIAVPTP
jgi:hypothetical protein